jgi:hypothetical protein
MLVPLRARKTLAFVSLVALVLTTACADSGDANIVESCSGQVLRARPKDPGQPGPWPVGALTTTLGGIRTEVWFPAVPGSQKGRDPVVYDVRDHIPEKDRGKVPEDQNPLQVCACFRDLPLDTSSGPYPDRRLHPRHGGLPHPEPRERHPLGEPRLRGGRVRSPGHRVQGPRDLRELPARSGR